MFRSANFRRHVVVRIYVTLPGITYLLSVPPILIAQPLAQDRTPFLKLLLKPKGRNAVSPRLAQRPRLFQFAFEASLFTLRANGPQMTPLFELPPQAGVPPFLPLSWTFFCFSHFSHCFAVRGFIFLFYLSLCSALAERHFFHFLHLFHLFHLFNAQRPRLDQYACEASLTTERANGPQKTPRSEPPPQ